MKTLIPNYTYEPEKIEHWLNQKLAEGFSMKKWGILFVHFEENASGIREYRVDVDDSRGEPNWERKTRLEECGWEYGKTVHDQFHIYSTRQNPSSFPENRVLREIGAKRTRRNAVSLGILAVVYLILFSLPLSLWRFLLLEVMRTHWILIAVYALFLPYIVGKFGVGAVHAWNLAKRMQQDNRMNHVVISKWSGWWSMAEVLLLIFLLVPLFMRVTGKLEDIQNVDQMEPQVSIVDLRRLEDDGFEITQISWNEHPEINFGNHIEFEPVLFADQYYTVEQYGDYRNKTDEFVQMSGEYWRIRSDWVAEKLYDQLYRRYVEFEKYGFYGMRVRELEKMMWQVDETVPEGFLDFAVARGTEEQGPYSTTQIFARTGDYVIRLEYTEATGHADTERFLDELRKEFHL